MHRVGWAVWADKPGDVFEERGKLQWDFIRSLLPGEFDFAGKQVLDFGCGVGRILTPAIAANPEATFTGAELDTRSVEWLRGNVPPEVTILQSSENPPLPLDAERFELIYAFSVFTHLLDSWSAWLVEMHRLLSDDGIAVFTIVGPGHSNLLHEPVSEDTVGMNVLQPAMSWDGGGPLIVHSKWWLRAHWGRAFEILDLRPGDPAGPPPLFGQGVIVMRKRPAQITIEELERIEPDEPREFVALRHNIMSLRHEVERMGPATFAASKLDSILTSKSWRMTEPLRAGARKLRQLRSPNGPPD
jgi:SAM-dependent methyltransferase